MTYTVEELKEIFRKHLMWLEDDGAGERADLSGANLRSADLSGTNLRGANLRYADLSGASLSGASLSGANLRGADLSGANLRYANLRSADLSSAVLSGANLRYANLSDANLRSADLRGADLILIGQDIRGYLFWAFVGDSGAVEIRAGCRHFVGISAARQHWTESHQTDKILHEDCLSLVDRCERMAKAREWKLEPEVKP